MTMRVLTEADDGEQFIIIATPPPEVGKGPHGKTRSKLTTYSTDDGLSVNWIDDETFEIVNHPTRGLFQVRRV